MQKPNPEHSVLFGESYASLLEQNKSSQPLPSSRPPPPLTPIPTNVSQMAETPVGTCGLGKGADAYGCVCTEAAGVTFLNEWRFHAKSWENRWTRYRFPLGNREMVCNIGKLCWVQNKR